MNEPKRALLSADLKVINIGLELFADSLAAQAVDVVRVNWKPPLELEPELERILDDLL